MRTILKKNMVVVISEPEYHVRRIYSNNTTAESWMSKKELKRFLKSIQTDGGKC